MKRTLPSLAAVAAGLVAPAALAATAVAAPAHHKPTHHISHAVRHAHHHHFTNKLSALDHRYLKLYNEAQSKLGTRAPGRNIVLDGLTPTKPATDAAIEKSIGTLTGMVAATEPAAAPAPVAVSAQSTSTSTATSTTTTTAPAAESTAPASSGLTSCIIERESGGDPDVVNSSGHMGEGQWAESTWLADGGGKYGATPLDASGAEQEQVIASQVAAGNTGQWTDYDGC
jgi:Transglycosylase-like domain